jgi:hypothetical protein
MDRISLTRAQAQALSTLDEHLEQGMTLYQENWLTGRPEIRGWIMVEAEGLDTIRLDTEGRPRTTEEVQALVSASGRSWSSRSRLSSTSR